MTGRPVKIGFLSACDPQDRRSWSGLMYSFFHAMKGSVGEVEHISLPPTKSLNLARRIASKLRRTLRVPGDVNQSVPLSLVYGRLYRKAILASACDLVFAPIASTEIGYLRSPVPLIYLSDATFRAMENYYFPLSDLHPIVRWEGNHLETRAIARADAIIYASHWAARSAVEHYGADSGKLTVVPFGANMDNVPARQSLRDGSTDSRCRLLLVGRDWKRKGAQIAYETLLALRERGIDAELTIVGCQPETPVEHPALRIVPFLDKNRPEQRTALTEFFLSSDIFLLPTRAECLGVVFCEASAYGLPIVSTDTGGVSTVVADGINGYLLPESAGAAAYADTIARLWQDPPTYRRMRHASRERYESRLNWNAWAEDVGKVVQHLMIQGQTRR